VRTGYGEPTEVGSKVFAVVGREEQDEARSLQMARPQSSLRCDLSIAENVSNVKTLTKALRKETGTRDQFGVHRRGREVDEETGRQ
jgi:hypothetical protein